MTSVIGAANFSSAVLADANLRFPNGVLRISPVLSIDATPDSLVISGPSGRQLLRCGAGKGPIVASLIRSALENDTNVIDQSKLDHKIVGLLHAAGAIEASTPVDAEHGLPESLVGYLSGSRDSSRRFASGEQIAAFVSGQEIRVSSDAGPHSLIDHLIQTGIDVVRATPEGLLNGAGFAGESVLTSWFLDHPQLESPFVAQIPEGKLDGEKVAPGWFVVGAEANQHLIRLVLRTDRWSRPAAGICDASVQELFETVLAETMERAPGDLRVAKALVAQEMVDLLGQVNQRPADTTIGSISGLGTLERSSVLLEWLAKETSGQSCCADSDQLASQQLAAYALLSEFSERHIQDPKGHQSHYLDANLAAQAKPRVLPTANFRVFEETGASESMVSVFEAVRFSVGIRRGSAGPKVSRFTASGGNMGSTAAVVELPVGFPHRYLLFDDQADRFVCLDLCSDEVFSSGTEKQAVLHLIAGVGRLGAKYGNLAYRISLADAGTALATVLEYCQANRVTVSLREGCALPDGLISSSLVGQGRLATSIVFGMTERGQ